MNLGSGLKPRLTQYTNKKNFVTSAKWALFSEPVTHTLICETPKCGTGS